MAKIFVYHRTLYSAFLDGHPAELWLDAVDRKGNDTHEGLWRVVGILDGAIEWLVDWRIAKVFEGATE